MDGVEKGKKEPAHLALKSDERHSFTKTPSQPRQWQRIMEEALASSVFSAFRTSHTAGILIYPF